MRVAVEWLHPNNHLNLENKILKLGLIAIGLTVFAESGLLIGFFFPGDSLLFTAGFLASQGYLDISILVIGSFIFAVAGDSIGYFIGKKPLFLEQFFQCLFLKYPDE